MLPCCYVYIICCITYIKRPVGSSVGGKQGHFLFFAARSPNASNRVCVYASMRACVDGASCLISAELEPKTTKTTRSLQSIFPVLYLPLGTRWADV